MGSDAERSSGSSSALDGILELSRYGVRPLKVTDLPLDVLRIIFNDFQEDAVTEGGRWHRRVSWGHYTPRKSRIRQRVIRKLRLVSRLFCELASPLLFPILHLRLSQSSLDLADNIASSPAIAAGVRGVRMSLRCRPKEHADDIARYRDSRLSLLQKQESWASHEYAPYAYMLDAHSDADEGHDFSESAGLLRALDNYRQIEMEWAEYCDMAAGRGPSPEGLLTEYQDILRKGYAKFCRLHREQDRLLQDATFASALAAAVARMPSACSFAFDDEPDRYAGYNNEISLLTNNTETLSRVMPAPLYWLEHQEETTYPRRPPAGGLECARLLWELPIALHRAGVTLAEMTIRSSPRYSNFTMLSPQDQTGAPAWDELSAASGTLEVLDCLGRTNNGDIGQGYFPDEDRSRTGSFLGAILSRCSRHLRVLALDFSNLSVLTGELGSAVRYYHADPVIARLEALPGIRHLSLGFLELHHEAFHRLCSNLGDKLEYVWLQSITLHDGGWADAIDMLREKTRPLSASAFPHGFYGLQGGEFRKLEPATSAAASDAHVEQDKVSEIRRLLEGIDEYVQRVRETNPLRGE